MGDLQALLEARAKGLGGTRLVLVAAGILLIGWGLADPLFRDPEGFLEGSCILPLAAGLGLILLGGAWNTSLRTSAAWLALALIGQAAALQLIDAGPFVRYQHYVGPRQLAEGFRMLPAALLGLQLACVVAAVRSRLSACWARLPRLETWRVALALLLFVLPSAILSRSLPLYVGELMLASAVQAVNVANVFLIVTTLPESWKARLSRATNRVLGTGRSELSAPRLDRFALSAAVLVAVLSIALGWLAYEHHPHVPDEVTYLLQARYLADGRIALAVPPVPEGFPVDIMSYDGTRWYSPMPPGWPALLSLGTETNLSWLVNPLLAAIGVCLVYLLLTDLYDRRVARTAVILLALSPWHMFLSMSFMSHTSALTMALLAGASAARYWRSTKLAWAIVAGGAVGLVSLIRPLDAVALATVMILAWATRKGPARRVKSLAFLLVTAALVGSSILPYNKALTGSATELPLASYTPLGQSPSPGANALGFGANRGWGWTGLDPLPGHGPIDAVINAGLNTSLINVELLGWSTGSFILLIAFLILGRPKGADFVMLGTIAMVTLVYSAYWFHGGPDFGARYWYLMIVPCVALSARGLAALNRSLRARTEEGSRRRFTEAATIGAAILCIVSLVTFVPWRAIDKYHHYRGMRPGAREVAEENDLGRSLLLVRGERHPDFASAFVYNPLDLDGDVPIFAFDKGPEIRRRLIQAYRDRPIWIVDGPTISGGGYRLAGQLLDAETGPPSSSLERE